MVDVAKAAKIAGIGDQYRLLGGVAVMMHVLRLRLDLPNRRTGDADFGVLPPILHAGLLVAELETLGYRKVMGNRWERETLEGLTASTDILVPSYTSRPRHTKRFGDVVTTEVPGLAFAFARPPVRLGVEVVLRSGTTVATDVLLPDALGMLVLKAAARKIRDEERDASDLWRCLEVAVAENASTAGLPKEAVVGDVGACLHAELGRGGRSIPALTADLTPEAAARLETRIQALLLRVTGY
jgi:hypothetical protein